MTADGTDEDAVARAQAIEAGRLLFARPWEFLRSAPNMAALPEPTGVEVAFAGRSNVGKSSLINGLAGRKGLARTSNTPGRTQELNFFSADTALTIVDMPGYGYARASKKTVAAWTRLVFAFLRGRANLRRVYLLVDARHGLKPADNDALDLLDTVAVSYQVVLTKADKPGADALQQVVVATRDAIAKRPASHPEIIVTSAQTGAGLDGLRAEIAALAT